MAESIFTASENMPGFYPKLSLHSTLNYDDRVFAIAGRYFLTVVAECNLDGMSG